MYACYKPGCTYTTNHRREHLNGHKRSAHTGEKIYCEHLGCKFETSWAKNLCEHRKHHRIVPQASLAALQVGARVEPRLSAEQLGEANAEEAAAPAARPVVEEERMASLPAELAGAEAMVEAKRGMAVAATEAHGHELRVAFEEAAALKAQLGAALDEQRRAALSSLIVQEGADSLRAELAEAKAAVGRGQAGQSHRLSRAGCGAQEHRRYHTGSCRGARA
mmetsp:Transcript_16100/g.41026  ORF Transcript_16100/g.41026 Transcript_16100/m.41026 type:complete len:221 (+) Transcript_16100:192-854(+)